MECEFTELVILPNTRPSVHHREVSQEAFSGSAHQLLRHLEHVISLSCGVFKSFNGSKSQCLIHGII